ncbi:MAG: hypothetical protein K5657_00485 [Desulfovibrio sp.]|nr:hypothetical protein [Desulfovibrio sp.]
MRHLLLKTLLFLLTLGFVTSEGLTEARAADVSQPEMKRMSTFLSNFTELGFMNFDVQKDGDENLLHFGADPSDPDLIRFGIMHNYVNNFKKRIKKCSTAGCKYGSLVIDATYVAESVKKYFGINLKHASVENSDPVYHFDGKQYHFEGADGEAVYHALVKEATLTDNVVHMKGDIFNAEDKDDRPSTFEATARPVKRDGKNSWVILSFKSTQR